MKSICAILGLPGGSLRGSIETAYSSVMANLADNNFHPGTRAAEQAAVCRNALEAAYKQFTAPGACKTEILEGPADNFDASAQARPRLGQMCVASGMITIEQLQEAVQAQVEESRPLGEVLQLKQFISQAELDGLLLGQEMIDVPSACVDSLGQRLISMGLVSEDMVFVCQMQQKAVGESVGHLLVRHGWVEPEVLHALSE